MIRKMLNRKWLLATVLVLIAAAFCARLGIWQLDRLAQRRAFNAHYVEMVSAAPVTLPTTEDLTGMEYRKITVTGHYDFSQQELLFNQYFRGQIGYHILTPLVLEDGNAILVDRGWIPVESKHPETWSRYDEQNPVEVSGIIRNSLEKADLTGQTDPTLAPGETRRDEWLFVNIPRLQQQTSYKLLPVYIQPDVDIFDETPPVPDQPEIEVTEGPHMGYALQWFTFAIIFVMGYGFYIRNNA